MSLLLGDVAVELLESLEDEGLVVVELSIDDDELGVEVVLLESVVLLGDALCDVLESVGSCEVDGVLAVVGAV